MGEPFDAIEFETWRARVERGETTLAGLTRGALEGVGVPPLATARTHGAARAVPSRASAKTQVVLRALDDGPSPSWLPAAVDGVWLAVGRGQRLAPERVLQWRARLPVGLSLFVDGDAEPSRLLGLEGVTAWIDPCGAGDIGEDAWSRDAIARWVADPHAFVWACDGAAWHDAGASAVDELAAALGGLLVAVRARERAGHTALPEPGAWMLRLGLGGSLLIDVAKLRAARALVTAVLSRLGSAPPQLQLWARSGRRNRAATDVDTNLVRASLEAFAAVSGGADGILLEPHDRRPSNLDDAGRWARNIAALLQHECHLDRVADPWAGAWAIEDTTAALAAAAWARVRGFEAAGGLGEPAVQTQLRRDVAATAAQRVAALVSGEEVLVGATRWPPPDRCTDHPLAEPGVLALERLAQEAGAR